MSYTYWVLRKQKMRVKPGPDPERPTHTKWMTSAEIDRESEKPSRKWIEAGSGEIGKLFVEVIGCDGLPNMDAAAMGGGKTDAFACLVYEDCVVSTEVLNDTLSPRWLPWTQRAFVFHITHPSSQLMVGVFDWDADVTGSHDPIGRVNVDITNLRSDTDYTVYYELFTSALVAKRKSNGRIKLRLRLAIPDQRKAVFAGMSPPPQIYVNVPDAMSYKVVKYTCEGKVSETSQHFWNTTAASNSQSVSLFSSFSTISTDST